MKQSLPIALPNQTFTSQQFTTLLGIINRSRELLDLLNAIGNHSSEDKEAVDSFLNKPKDDKTKNTLGQNLQQWYSFKPIVSDLADLGQYIKVQEYVADWYPAFKNSKANKADRMSFLNHLYKQGFDVISWIEKFDDVKMYKNFINKEPSRINEDFVHKSLLNFKHVYHHEKYTFDEIFELLKQFPKNEKSANLIYNVYKNLQHYETVSYFLTKELNSYPLETLKKLGVPDNLIQPQESPLATIECKDTHRTVFSLSENYFEDKFKKLHTSHHTKVTLERSLIKRFFAKHPHYKEKYEFGGFDHKNPEDNLQCALDLKELINTTDLTPMVDLVKKYRKSLDVTYIKNEHRKECLEMMSHYLDQNSLYNEQPLEKISAHIANNDKYSVYLAFNLSYIHDKTGGSVSSKPTLRKMWAETLAKFVKEKINEQLGVTGSIAHESGRVTYEFTEKEMQQKVKEKLEEYKEFLCSSTVQSGLEQYSTKEELDKCLNYLYLTHKIETKYSIDENTKTVKKRKI